MADNPNGTKERQMVQLVTPENPQYMYKFAECMVDVDVDAASICGERGVVKRVEVAC